jgi:hypothetical protein
MAVGPGGRRATPAPCAELSADQAAFVQGLEGVIDRALQGLRPGERFVYGIHQELAGPIARCVERRYLEAGWAEARVLPGATGAATLVLAP